MNHAFHDEVATRYAELVAPRALAVYRLGEIRDRDRDPAQFLVMTGRVGLDNPHFFSAYERLPHKYYRALAGEPYILPAWSARVIRHVRPQPRALLSGRDLLHAYGTENSVSERWCRLLETFCRHAIFSDAQHAESDLHAAQLQLRDELDDAGELVRIELRGTYPQMVAALERALQDKLPAANTTARIAAAREVLQGERPFEGIDQDEVVQRTRDINGYFHELASMRFPYGTLFPYAAYPRAVRALPQAPVVTTLVRNFYAMRRRLFEYAGA